MAEAPHPNPWRELRRRTHLTLHWADLPNTRGALTEHPDGTRSIILDRNLTRRQRVEVLAHELVHDTRSLPCTPDLPAGLVQAEERAVDRATLDWLIPPDQLDELVARLEAAGEPVDAAVVRDAFPDATLAAAARALRLLRIRRARNAAGPR